MSESDDLHQAVGEQETRKLDFERASFEAAMREHYSGMKINPDFSRNKNRNIYRNAYVEARWHGWKLAKGIK